MKPQVYAAQPRSRPPVVVVSHSVVKCDLARSAAVTAGMSVWDAAPRTDLPFIAILNGEPILRREWTRKLCVNDILVFQIMPQGGGGEGGSNPLQAILQIALMVAVAVFAPYAAGAVFGAGYTSFQLAITQAAMMLVGSALISAIVPLPSQSSASTGQTSGQSSTYNVALQGNTARLDQPMPVVYGRNSIYCDFAAQPYSEYIDGEQFYYALFVIGQGYYDIESIKIDDTLLENFDDVTPPLVIQPGGSQSLVATNIVTAPEISGQTLVTNQPLGPFTACGLGRKAVTIIVDITMPRGLFHAANDGSLNEDSVAWRVEARSITDFDQPISSWKTLGNETFSAAQGTPVRLTYKYPVSAARYEVRVTRVDEREDNNRIANDIIWESMRAELNVPGVTNTTSTMLAIKLRASEQLSGLSQRRFNVVCTRKLHTWTQGGGWSASPVATNSIGWALADILRDPNYGEGRPDNRIDLNGIVALNAIWFARKDTFNGVFDSLTTVQEALMQVARVGRAVPVPRAGVMTFVRDGPQTLPRALFNNRNIVKNSLQLEYILRNENTADALDVEYWEERLWSWKPAPRVLAPGVTTPVNVAKLRYFGVTNEAHVLRDAKHIVADTAYRRVLASFSTELTGHIPGYGSLIVVAHDLPGWASGGQIIEYDGPTKIAKLSEPVTFTQDATHYVRLEAKNGQPYGPYEVVAGESEFHIVFVDEPEFAINVEYDYDQTRYMFGAATNYGKLMRVLRVSPRNDNTVEIRAVVEDDRVHTYELTGDQGSGGIGGGGGGAPGFRGAIVVASTTPMYDDASEAQRNAGAWVSNSVGTISGDDPYITQAAS